MWILIDVFKWLYLFDVLLLFPLLITVFVFMPGFFFTVLSGNPSADVNVSRDLNIHQSE